MAPSPETSRTALVTGASAGIGAAVAREYARRGWDVALAARRAEPMEALADELRASHGVRAEVFAGADLFDPETPARLYGEVVARMGTVDGLVNNAGYGHPGRYLASPWEDHARFIQLMLTAPSQLAHLASASMKARGFGRIMNVASLAGHLPGTDGHTLYAAVKSYLVKFSQSLNAELKGTGVYVSALCPGFTFTEFHDVNGTRDNLNQLPGFMMQSAEAVAKSGVDALERNKAVHVTGAVNKTIAAAARLMPGAMSQNLMEKNSSRFREQ